MGVREIDRIGARPILLISEIRADALCTGEAERMNGRMNRLIDRVDRWIGRLGDGSMIGCGMI
jgi:hypothetical protein